MRFFTVLPSAPPDISPEPPLYRKIVGLEWQDKLLTLPIMPKSVFVEDFKVSQELGDGIALCFDYYYLRNPKFFRNCHLGALAMTRRRIFSGAKSFMEANYVAMNRKPATFPLPPGAWAVKAMPFDGAIHLHSIVGLSEDTIVQIDNARADMSLAGYVPPEIPDFPYYIP